jgi:alginate O-acetyltransferase complex protein AlgI
VCSLATKGARARIARTLGLANRPLIHKAWSVATTFSLICFSWIFFRAASLADSIEIVKRSAIGVFNLATFQVGLASIRGSLLALGASKTDLFIAAAAIGILEAVQIMQREGDIRDLVGRLPEWGRWTVYYGLTLIIVFCGVFAQSAFIYFQF